MPALKELAFRFDPGPHVYTDLGGRVIPGITGLIEKAGKSEGSNWYTEESRVRGTAVHDLTAAYDLGALDPSTLVSPYKGYVLAYVAAMHMLQPTILAVEEPDACEAVDGSFRFGGRPDRIMLVKRVRTILEIKTGGKEPGHPIQTALQALLDSTRSRLPAPRYQRLALYLQPNGRYDLQRHPNPTDHRKALDILKEHGR